MHCLSFFQSLYQEVADLLLASFASKLSLKVETLRSNGVNGIKNISIWLPKRSVAYLATAVETVFVVFLKFL